MVAAALSGCGTLIDSHTPPPADWPELAIHERRVSAAQMLAYCYPRMGLGMKLLGGVPIGCATIDFARERCDVWLPAQDSDADLVAAIATHERLHCRGYDHHGDRTLADAWARYKAAQP